MHKAPLLTETDLQHPAVVETLNYMETRIRRLARELEGDHDEISTAKLRGKIKELRSLYGALTGRGVKIEEYSLRGESDDVSR